MLGDDDYSYGTPCMITIGKQMTKKRRWGGGCSKLLQMPRAVTVAGEAVVTSGGRLYCIFYLELQLCLAAGRWARLGRHFRTCDS